MSVSSGHHPILGPGLGGFRAWLWALLLLLTAFTLGLVFTYFNPVLFGVGIVALVALVVLIRFSAAHPVGALCLVVGCQILMPVYIRLPLGLPPPLVVLAILIIVVAARKMLDPVPSKPGKYEHLIATLLLIYNVVLASTIPNEYASFGSVAMLIKTVTIPTILFIMVVACIRSPTQLVYVYRTITVAAVACAMLAVHEFINKKNVLAAWLAPPVTIEEDFFLWLLANTYDGDPYLGGSIYRVYSFFTQPLEYSAFMVMAFPFAALMFVTTKSLWSKLLYGATTGAIFIGFIVTFSRGPTLALAIVILFLGVYERRVRPWILAGAAALGTGLVVYWPLVVEKLGDRVTNTENITLRVSLWKNGLQIFAQNPLRGIGYGSYPNYHVDAIRENQIGPMYEYHWAHIERVTTMENIFVTLAAETGVMGLASYFALLLASFVVFRRVYRQCKDEMTRLMALSAAGACLGYLLSGMTVANNIGYTISILFFGVYVATFAILSRQLPAGRLPPLMLLNFVQFRAVFRSRR